MSDQDDVVDVAEAQDIAVDEATGEAVIDDVVTVVTPEGDVLVDETIAVVGADGEIEVVAEEISAGELD
jgi:hypothetical protein